MSGERPSAAGQLGRGMLVFCDPKTSPPENASDFGDCYFDRLSRLVDSYAVTVLGEVGLDCSEGAKSFAVQYITL